MDEMQMTALLLGLGLLGYGAFQLYRRFMLSKCCTAQAAGTFIPGTNRSAQRRAMQGKTNIIGYEYTVDGVQYKNYKHGLTMRQYKELRNNDDFPVLYDPAKPKRSHISVVKIGMFVPICCIVGGLLFFWAFFII